MASNSDLRSGAEPVTAVKRGDHQCPQNSNLTSTFISLPFSYLISVIQHVPGIDLTAHCRRQYFGIFLPLAMQTARDSRVCTATIDCPRCTCGMASCYLAHAHTPLPSPASWKLQLYEVVSAVSAASGPAKCGLWGNTQHRARRRLTCARGRSHQQRCPYYQQSSDPASRQQPAMKSRSIPSPVGGEWAR